MAGAVAVADVARFPGALEVLEGPEGLDEDRRRELLACVTRALDGLQGMRDTEGAHLQEDLHGALAAIDGAARRIAEDTEAGEAARGGPPAGKGAPPLAGGAPRSLASTPKTGRPWARPRAW